MKLKQIFISFVLILFFIAGIYFLFMNDSVHNISGLYPRSGDSNLSGEFKNAQRSVNFYREQIERNPNNPENYTGLAQVFIQEARITGKQHEYFPKVISLVETALNLDKENLDANLTKASVLLAMHQFEEAAMLGEWAVKKYPFNSAAYGILVDAYVELGNYEQAVEKCDKMLELKPDLRSYSRASYLREIHGDISGAIDAMRMAADAGVAGQENRAWVLSNLANLYLQAGKIDTAFFIYSGILEERSGYAYALSGLANVEIVKGDYSRGINYLKQASKNMDDHSLIEQLSDFYLAVGNKSEEEKIKKVIFDEFEEHEKRGWNINLEYADFCLTHNLNLEEALQRSNSEYKRRPDNIEVIDTYAWALYKNGNSNKAAELIEKVISSGMSNALIYYHAGVINYSIGKNDKAKKYLELALNQNLSVNLLSYKDAKDRLAKLREIASIN